MRKRTNLCLSKCQFELSNFLIAEHLKVSALQVSEEEMTVELFFSGSIVRERFGLGEIKRWTVGVEAGQTGLEADLLLLLISGVRLVRTPR
uniref:Uncharacterized protein n=1 Tax=Chromera velia CCMP2878 TaxID=1169474 RepID=A0A0G4FYR3_9ALVE|eukprot:Cvel_19406.t1-p1 / transcript=Cvel_19406.t1 / gene=Cvel_19406 / organism=Chromera_velia_CCMP2878 / gene_product=hypothetical protein / transcript_product=hypothetical protein / location=Cvel_scaffold1671:4434-4703(-) / protein_length=90 / sequence_SO=supercontig / SO=protein_coding / is_pseudo=false